MVVLGTPHHAVPNKFFFYRRPSFLAFLGLPWLLCMCQLLPLLCHVPHTVGLLPPGSRSSLLEGGDKQAVISSASRYSKFILTLYYMF